MRKAIITAVILIIICVIAVFGIAFAYYEQTFGGWEQNITATTVAFRVNGKSVNSVTAYDLGLLSKGDEAEVDLEVLVKANASTASAVAFSINNSFAEGSELANAIEVYFYEDGEYVYRMMLSSFDTFTDTIGINVPTHYHYKLVYSPAASDYFEGKSFDMTLTAVPGVFSGESNTYYISDFDSFAEAALMEESQVSGKTFTLRNDITVTSDITFAYPISIELAGHTLTLAPGVKLTVNSSKKQDLKITNNNPIEGGLSGTGGIVYNMPLDAAKSSVVFVQDSLSAGFALIDVNNVRFEALAELLSANVTEVNERIWVVGDKINYTTNLKYYLSAAYGERLIVTPPQLGDGADTSVITAQDLDNSVFAISDGYSVAMTSEQEVLLSLANTQGDQATLEFELVVRGTSAQALAEYWLAKIPDVVYGSLYFAGYDHATMSTLTWVTSENLISEYGIYLPNGYDVLTSWQDTTMELGLIVDCAGEQVRVSKVITVELLDAEHRTNRIYDYQQIIISTSDSSYSLYDENVDAAYAQKAGLYDIEATILVPSQNRNKANQPYIRLDDGDNGFEIAVINLPAVDEVAQVDLSIEFTYLNGTVNGEQQYVTYSIYKTVSLVGSGQTQIYEPTNFLQQEFDINGYVNGEGYTFLSKAMTQYGAKVDYFVDASAAQYVIVENDVYVAEEGGAYVYHDGDYRYVESRYAYNAQTGEYESSLDGTYMLYNYTYVDISDAIDNNGFYNRYTRFGIKPANVPGVEQTIVPIYAQIWDEYNPNGSKNYFVDTNSEVLRYELSLVVVGIYHNIDTEIASYPLYNVLLEYFDLNGDGWINAKEAKTEWLSNGSCALAKELSVATYSGKDYHYIDLSAKTISSIKGLEYFTTALGFDLSDNDVIGLDYLGDLFKLEYLDLSANRVADLQYLQYLDNLEILLLQSLPFVTIEPIQYLPSVVKLDLYHCENITSYEYISDYQHLKYLDIRQAGRNASITADTSYYLALLFDINRANGMTVYRDGTTTWTPGDAEVVAAKVLSEFVVVNEVYTSLNIPNTYYYEYTVNSTRYKKSYNVAWWTDLVYQSYLSFTTVNGKTTGYEIHTPIVDKVIEISVSVTEQNSATAISVTRPFYINLLQSQEASDTIYLETSAGVFQIAKEVVTDTTLLDFLVNNFNTNTSGNVPGRTADGALTGSDTTYLESNTISYSELNTLDSNEYPDAFRNAGITSLAGLSVFKNAIGFPMDLSGNVFTDPDTISELAEMSNVDEITLSGQNLDFTNIASYTMNNGVATVEGLTNLTALYVYGCLELDTADKLAALYQVYLANPNVAIYKDSNTVAWDPYETILPKYVQGLPSAYVFINYNDTANYYEGDDVLYDGSNNPYYSLNIYGVTDLSFTLVMSDDNLSGYQKSNFTHTASGVQYETLVGYSDVVYDKVTFSGADTHGALTYSHHIQLKMDFNHRIMVVNYPEKSGYVSMDTIFPGRDVRKSVMSRLTTLFDNNSSAAALSAASIGSGYYKDGDNYYITMNTLNSLAYTETLDIDGTYIEQAGNNAIQGLQYLSVTSAHITRDANLGDGTYLQGLSVLTIGYSGADFSTISIDLPNMRELYVGYSGNKVEENRYTVLYDNSTGTPIYNLAHFTGLTTLRLTDSNCYEWTGLRGLIGLDIEKLYIYGTSGTYSNKNNTYSSTIEIVSQIYGSVDNDAATKDYRLGTSINSNDNATRYTGTWVSDISGTTEVNLNDAVKEYNEFAPQILTLGVKINNDYHYASADAVLADDGTITLPEGTAEFFYGTSYDADAVYFERNFAISWRICGLNAATLNELFGITASSSGTMATANLTNVPYCVLPSGVTTLTANALAYDCYFIIVGTIGGGYLDSEGDFTEFPSAVESYDFAFPVTVSGTTASSASTTVYYKNASNVNSTRTLTDADFYNATVTVNNVQYTVTYLSYLAFSDPNLRYAMYVALGAQPLNTTSPFAKLGTIVYNITSASGLYETGALRVYKLVLTSTSVKLLWESNANSGISATVAHDVALSFASYAPNMSTLYFGSLDGIGHLRALRELEAANSLISDIGDLAKQKDFDNCKFGVASSTYSLTASGLASVNLSGNPLSDISVFSGMTMLTSIVMQNALIGTLEDANGLYVFKSSLSKTTALDLTGNSDIDDSDLLLIKQTVQTESVCALASLGLNGTACCYSSVALGYVAAMATVKGSAISLTINQSTSSVTETTLNAFLSEIGANATINGYITNGYQLNSTFSLSLTLGLGSYSLTLLDADNLINTTTGAPLDSVKDAFTSTTTTLRVALTNTVYQIDYTINLVPNGGANQTVLPFYIDKVLYTQSDFDVALWTYMIKNSVNDGSKIDYTSTETLTLDQEIGLKSLKGLQYFTKLTTLSIQNQRYLTELWNGSFTTLKTLSLGNCPSLTTSGLSALRYATALKTLDLSKLENVDYLEQITVNSASTTLADVILTNCTALKSLYISNAFNFGVYGGANLKANVIENLDADNYLFDIGTGTNANAKKLSSFSGLDLLNVYCAYSGTAMRYRDYADVYLQIRMVIDTTIANAVTYAEGAESSLSSQSNIELVSDYAALLASDMTRELIPTTIYQYGIENTINAQGVSGVSFYLPRTLNYGGTALTFAWSLLEGVNSESLDNDVSGYLAYSEGYSTLHLDSTNYVLKDGAYDELLRLTYTLSSDGTEVASESIDITIVPSTVTWTNSTVRLSPYYVEMPDGNGGTRLEPATDYFTSSRFLYWLFNNADANISAAIMQITAANFHALDMTVSDIGKYYLSYVGRNNVTSMTIPNEGITSIKGIDLFPNLNSFSIAEGYILSLEPLSKLQLVSFSYYQYNITISDKRNSIIQDFTPLLNSAESLESFSYISKTVYGDIDDLSILMSFGEQLVSINFGLNATSPDEGYVNTAFFRYMVNWFSANRPDTQVFYNQILQVAGDEEEKQATDILSRLDTTSCDVAYVNNFELKLSDALTADANGDFQAKIPVGIDIGGKIYPIKWKSLSSFIEVSEIVYRGASFSATVDGASVTVSNGSVYTVAQYEQITAQASYMYVKFVGSGDFERIMTIHDKDKNTLNVAFILARITINGHDYERCLTINCNDNNIYHQISLDEGQGSFMLPLLGNTSYTGWSILNANGEAVSSYSGLFIGSFTEGGCTRQILLFTDPAAVGNGEIKLVNAAGTEYVLYHKFTAADLTAINEGTATGKYAEQYGIAVKLIGGLSALMAAYNTQTKNYDEGRILAEDYEDIVLTYNTAVAAINAASFANKKAISDAAIADINSYEVRYYAKWYDATGNQISSTLYSVGATITIPTEAESGTMLTYDTDAFELVGWLINGQNYVFESTYTMIATDVRIMPNLMSIDDYYLVRSGEESTYATTGWKLNGGQFVFGGKTYLNAYLHLQLNDSEANDTTYKVLSVNNGGYSEVENASVTLTGQVGNYSFYFDNTSNSSKLVYSTDTYVYSAMGYGVCSGGWLKPNQNLLLKYDQVNNFYYATTVTRNENATKNYTKVSAYIDGKKTSGGAHGTDFYTFIGTGLAATGGDISVPKTTTITIYFTPSCALYDATLGEGSIVGFTATSYSVNAATNGIIYGVPNCGGLLIVAGDYETTIDTALAHYSTATYGE